MTEIGAKSAISRKPASTGAQPDTNPSRTGEESFQPTSTPSTEADSRRAERLRRDLDRRLEVGWEAY